MSELQSPRAIQGAAATTTLDEAEYKARVLAKRQRAAGPALFDLLKTLVEADAVPHRDEFARLLDKIEAGEFLPQAFATCAAEIEAGARLSRRPQLSPANGFNLRQP